MRKNKNYEKNKAIIAIFNTSLQLIEALELALQSEGYQTVSGIISELMPKNASPREALDSSIPDVFICDVGMPQEEILEWINKKLILSGITGDAKVILTTTNLPALKALVPSTTALDVSNAIEKPFSLDMLLKRVKQAVKEVRNYRKEKQVATGKK